MGNKLSDGAFEQLMGQSLLGAAHIGLPMFGPGGELAERVLSGVEMTTDMLGQASESMFGNEYGFSAASIVGGAFTPSYDGPTFPPTVQAPQIVGTFSDNTAYNSESDHEKATYGTLDSSGFGLGTPGASSLGSGYATLGDLASEESNPTSDYGFHTASADPSSDSSSMGSYGTVGSAADYGFSAAAPSPGFGFSSNYGDFSNPTGFSSPETSGFSSSETSQTTQGESASGDSNSGDGGGGDGGGGDGGGGGGGD